MQVMITTNNSHPPGQYSLAPATVSRTALYGWGRYAALMAELERLRSSAR